MMTLEQAPDLLRECLRRLRSLVEAGSLLNAPVTVMAGPLSPGEAIGNPHREDFALLRGREVMVEAVFRESRGQAFSAVPVHYQGTLNEVLSLDLEEVGQRAIFTATMNAVLHHLGHITGTRHCRDESPERCARQVVELLDQEMTAGRIGLIGYQPALLEHLSRHFEPEQVRASDLSSQNLGQVRFGVPIWDGAHCTKTLVDWADTLLVTGSTVVNGTAGRILQLGRRRGIEPLFYGVTVAGVSQLLGLGRVCPEARDDAEETQHG